ncbi:TetR/AcrR family transcriptional regulator C-terminal domain-containing protein [Nocardioides sp. SYSU DS0663]|uniref:TetR/AcrR family transcriptional regulator C-terminal domain-containing protein n=1 Tax=Nocardioides sp. SYSU DS0663 TaxID=3416445 RepID=UPI003F4C7E20
MAVADAHGLAHVTMRRVAADLGVEAMSLYHHVANKDALLDGLAEAVVQEVHDQVAATGSGAPDADWRATLRRRFLTARSVMLQHPWAPGLLGSRPAAPAALLAYYDEVLATMLDGGLSYRLAHRGLHAFGSLALGFAQELFPAPPADAAATTPSEAERAALAEAFPHLAAMTAAEIHDADGDVLGWCDSQTEFEFTLDLLLDGLERARSGED